MNAIGQDMRSIGQAAQESTFDGWTRQQYAVAAQWMRDSGVTFSIVTMDDLLDLKLEWVQRFEYDPLVGPMKVYDPKIDADLALGIKARWTHMRLMYGQKYTATESSTGINATFWGNRT